jgi:hypothetical protein
MKICICLCLSKKNKRFLNKSINSINDLFIPSGYKLDLSFVLPNNFYYQKHLIKKKIILKCVNLKFLFQSKVGIPFARNTFLNYVRPKDYDFLGFIDDDCSVDKYWLFNMAKLMKLEKPDIIGGPQHHKTKLEHINNYYNLIEPNYKNKEKVKWVATNNAFFNKKIITEQNIEFDVRLNKIGGSDQLFFKNYSFKGYKLLWNKNAIVTEHNSEERNKLKWFLLRNFRYGYSGYYIDKTIYGTKKGFLINIIKILILILISILNLFFLFFKKKRALALFSFSRLIGRTYALIGHKVKKYN